MKLNLGCGRNPLPGFVNVDLHDGPGVDCICDIADGLPFPDGSAEFVYASHVLEHILDLDAAMREIARVLKPGKLFLARVPLGLRYLRDAFHYHAFDRRTLLAWTQDNMGLQSRRLFRVESNRVTDWELPFRWHLRHYLPRLNRLLMKKGEDGLERPRVPLGIGRELTVALRRLL